MPTPTDSELAAVPVPCRSSVDTATSKGAPVHGVKVNMLYVGVAYHPIAVLNTVQLARCAAKECILPVGGLNWDNMKVLVFILERSLLDARFCVLAR